VEGGELGKSTVKLAMDKRTSWQGVAKSYSNQIGQKGDYYHQQVILPNLIRLLELKPKTRLLDLACGEGILARSIPAIGEYLGYDISPSLVEEARSKDIAPNHYYGVGDVTKELTIRKSGFDRATIILALQNIKQPFKAIRNAGKHLVSGGRLIIVLNHPSFRIPQHSGWGTDKENKLQYRKVDSYMTALEIAIDSNPFFGKNNRKTYSYHYPLSVYSEMIFDAGFLLEKIEEWISPKVSDGGMAQIENRARKEFPLFMALVAVKK
jgi:ubiquinone/menaquinone biosynthesis C-methylase UbiE